MNYPPNTIDWQPGDLVITDANQKVPDSLCIVTDESPGRWSDPAFLRVRCIRHGTYADLPPAELHSPLAFPETREWFTRQYNLRCGEIGWDTIPPDQLGVNKPPIPRSPLGETNIVLISAKYAISNDEVRAYHRAIDQHLAGVIPEIVVYHLVCTAIHLRRATDMSLDQVAEIAAQAVNTGGFRQCRES